MVLGSTDLRAFLDRAEAPREPSCHADNHQQQFRTENIRDIYLST